jgi:hypothetical protein
MDILQMNRIAPVVAFGAFQFRFPLRRSHGHKAFAAKGMDCSVRVGAVDEEGFSF